MMSSLKGGFKIRIIRSQTHYSHENQHISGIQLPSDEKNVAIIVITSARFGNLLCRLKGRFKRLVNGEMSFWKRLQRFNTDLTVCKTMHEVFQCSCLMAGPEYNHSHK